MTSTRNRIPAVWVVVGAWAVSVAGASSALAQDRDPYREPELQKSLPSSGQLLAGPTLFETGRVAASAVTDPGAIIQGRQELTSLSEAAVHITAVAGELTFPGAPRRPAATSDPVALEREVRAHLAALSDCRLDAARREQIRPDQVVASEVVLRWTILPTGAVSDTAVVATQPIDSGVTDCVKQRMNSWTFSPLAGASADLERILVFAR